MRIINGDCLEELKKLPDNSVDSIVSDPPAGIEFMGKEWDSFKDNGGQNKYWCDKKESGIGIQAPRFTNQTNKDLQCFQDFICQVFSEAIRVLKPGGHALIWAIPRTSHHTAMGLERAGFEIRDCVYHVFGSGFPKSLNIGKKIDQLQGNEREAYERPDFVARSNKTPQRKSQVICGEKGKYTKGNSPWEGWGTALKPAVECWWLCRKPLGEKTVAENCLKWGTGGINIEKCRVALAGEWDKGTMGTFRKAYDDPDKTYDGTKGNVKFGGDKLRADRDVVEKFGRFPSHLIHDGSEEVISGFPNTKSGARKGKNPNVNSFNNFFETKGFKYTGGKCEGSEGSASRFFYCAKASKAERNRGCEGLEEKLANKNGKGLGRECSLDAREQENGDDLIRMKNNHPTVKPLSLMKYLVRLITPPNGTVLDPFMGSGSTGIGAKLEGFDFIGIEKEPEYFEIAKARIDAWQPDRQEKLL